MARGVATINRDTGKIWELVTSPKIANFGVSTHGERDEK
jgi:hypothetical protein